MREKSNKKKSIPLCSMFYVHWYFSLMGNIVKTALEKMFMVKKPQKTFALCTGF